MNKLHKLHKTIVVVLHASATCIVNKADLHASATCIVNKARCMMHLGTCIVQTKLLKYSTHTYLIDNFSKQF